MAMSKCFSKIPSYRLWLLSSAMALMVLVTWSQVQQSRTGKLTNTAYAHFLTRRTPLKGADALPILAYWILGSKGENRRIMRLLKAIYHPRNQYLLQLDSAAHDHERTELALLIHSELVFRAFGNVEVVGKSYAINPTAASGLAAVLHAAALLLRVNADWDWFIPLSTSDYPTLSQDDVLYAFSSLPRDVIFMGYSNGTSLEKFTLDGSDQRFLGTLCEWMGQSSQKATNVFNNVVYPLESYFQTVLCNTPEFQNTTLVNDNLRYTVKNTNIKEGYRERNTSLSDPLTESVAIFARPFREDDPELQEIDEKLLNRDPGKVVPGKWCIETGIVNETLLNLSTGEDICSVWGDIDSVQPGGQGIKLQEFFFRVAEEKKMASSQCQSQSHFMHSFS